jgi:hypothetical protein
LLGGHSLDTTVVVLPVPPKADRLVELLPAPTRTANLIQVWPAGWPDALNPVTVSVATSRILHEHEPNDIAEQAQALMRPVVVCGRFDRPGDQDLYTVAAKANEPIAFDLLCERLGSPGDPRIVVLDEQGNDVLTIEDHGIDKGSSVVQNNRDPVGLFTPPADGTYRVLVQDTYGQGGLRFVYALRVRPQERDFAPVAFTEDLNEPMCPTVRQGGSALVEICLNRRDGFDGAVTIEAQGLPHGVSAPHVHISPQTEFGDLVFIAARNAAAWAGAIRLKARAKIGDVQVERDVLFTDRRWASGEYHVSRMCRELCIAVRPGAPYVLKLPGEPVSSAPGTLFEVRARIERHREGLTEPVRLSGLNPPPGFEIASAEIPPAETEAIVRVSISAETPPGTYTLIFRGDAQVPFSPDPAVTDPPRVRVADPSTPLTVIVTAPPLPNTP